MGQEYHNSLLARNRIGVLKKLGASGIFPSNLFLSERRIVGLVGSDKIPMNGLFERGHTLRLGVE
jgi:hypothetical protein